MDNRDPLNLKLLPEERAPADLWPAIESRLSGRGRIWPKAAGFAAAGLAAALVIAVVSVRNFDKESPAENGIPLAELQARSAALEEVIAPLRPVAPAAGTAQRAAVIESLLAEVDRALYFAPNDARLWRRRVQLLDALAASYSENWMDQQAQLTSL